MEWIFANPLGWWALLGVPAVLLIHLLQRQSQELTVSTLFLLQQLHRESREGRKIDRLSSSVPLWLQLLIVLLVTWILVDPRRLRPESVQPVAVVLDDSASLSAFRDEARKELEAALRRLAPVAKRSEYSVVGSTLSGRNFYRGTDLDALLASLDAWEPLAGEHEVTDALRVARNAVGPSGVVLLLTDTPRGELPFEARALAVGRPVPNVGFTGFESREAEDGGTRWRAVVRNFAAEPAERGWFLASGEQRSPVQTIRLDPGEVRVLEGGFPDGAGDRLRLELAGDDFRLDDVLPVLRPEPRLLFTERRVSPRLERLTDQVAASLPQSRPAEAGGAPPDLVFAGYDPLDPAWPEGNAVVFLDREPKFAKPVAGRLLAEPHPFLERLNWEPLIHYANLGVPRGPSDQVLLWREETPLILLRQTPSGARQLVFGFDVASSNADRLPAFILAIHRFADAVRADKPVLERRVLETGQPVRVPVADASPDAPPLRFRFTAADGSGLVTEEEVPVSGASRARAPLRPGYLAVSQGEVRLLEAAVFFADVREGDFRRAGREDAVSGLAATLVPRHTERRLALAVWVPLVLGVLLASWAWMAWREAAVAGAEPDPAHHPQGA
jgi:hypothetical protein